MAISMLNKVPIVDMAKGIKVLVETSKSTNNYLFCLKNRMTRSEFDGLSLSDRYKFVFYHGRVEYGILLADGASGKIYLVDHRQLRTYKNENKSAQEVGEEINIGTIAYWESIEGTTFPTEANAITIFGMPKATKLIIIGAGALIWFYSRTTKTIKPYRPPLARDLFPDRYDPLSRIHYPERQESGRGSIAVR